MTCIIVRAMESYFVGSRQEDFTDANLHYIVPQIDAINFDVK